MEIELKIRTDLHSGSKDKPKIVKRDALQLMSVDHTFLGPSKQRFLKNGKIDPDYCLVYIKEMGDVIVNHSYEYIRNLKLYSGNRIGFEYKYRDQIVKRNGRRTKIK